MTSFLLKSMIPVLVVASCIASVSADDNKPGTLARPIAVPPPVAVNACALRPSTYACVLAKFSMESRDSELTPFFSTTPAGANLKRLVVISALSSAADTPAGKVQAQLWNGLNTDAAETFKAIQFALDKLPAAAYPNETALLTQLVSQLDLSAEVKFNHFLGRLAVKPAADVSETGALAEKLAILDQIDTLGVTDAAALEKSVDQLMVVPALKNVRAPVLSRYARFQPVAAARISAARSITLPTRRQLKLKKPTAPRPHPAGAAE